MQSVSVLLQIAQYLYTLLATCCGDSSEGIANGCGLEDAGIESWWRRDFPRPSWATLEPTPPSAQGVLSLPRQVKRTDRGVDQPPPSSAQFKEKVAL